MNFDSNGRVDILGPIGPQFQLADKIPVKHCVSFRDALTGQWTDSLLSCAFFSAENIQILQNAIRKGVYEKSNGQYVIGQQNCSELKIIMRSIFLQHANNLPCDIKYQIITLNKLVTDFAIEQVYKEAVSYIKYKFDASTLSVPISTPVNTSPKTNTLELQPFF
tara:strand:- start:504 stop:995 length:492 start_codon:yes stop_codon:yes gene_type:complete